MSPISSRNSVPPCASLNLPSRPLRSAPDRLRQQLLAGAGLALQQHGAVGGGDTPCLALDFERRRAGADEGRDRVLGPPLRGQLAPRCIELALQPRELGHQRLHRRLGVIHQHQPECTDHAARVVAQRQPADQERARLVAQQVDQDRAAALDHLRHQRVRHHVLDPLADELVLGAEAQRRQEALVAIADPDHAVVAVDHHHAHGAAREDVEHAARRKLQQAVGIVGQGGDIVHRGHCSELGRAPATGKDRGGSRRRCRKRLVSLVVRYRPAPDPPTEVPHDPACTACCARRPSASTRLSSTPTRCRSGCRPTASPPRCTRWTRASAGASACFNHFSSGHSHAFGGEYLELVPHERCATPTVSTTRTCPARWS
jgi:hypothetical protein